MLIVEDGWCLHVSAWHLKGKDLWALWVATWCQVWMRVMLQKSHSSSTGQSCHVCLEQIWSIFSFTVTNTNTRTWCVDVNPPLFAWICPAPMFLLWQLGEVLVPSLVAFETSFIISRIEATSGSITETKTFTTLSPCLSNSAHGAHGAHGARCMHPPIESFCVCWHMLAPLSHFAAIQFWFPKHRFVRPTKKRFNFSFFPTGSTDPMNRRQTWPNGSTGEGQNRQNELFGDV